jgi:hypothetical protein
MPSSGLLETGSGPQYKWASEALLTLGFRSNFARTVDLPGFNWASGLRLPSISDAYSLPAARSGPLPRLRCLDLFQF